MKEHNLEAFYKYYSNATKEQAIEDMYMDNCKLTEENEYLRYIIKEVREYIEEVYKRNENGTDNIWILDFYKISEILDKEDI